MDCGQASNNLLVSIAINSLHALPFGLFIHISLHHRVGSVVYQNWINTHTHNFMRVIGHNPQYKLVWRCQSVDRLNTQQTHTLFHLVSNEFTFIIHGTWILYYSLVLQLPRLFYSNRNCGRTFSAYHFPMAAQWMEVLLTATNTKSKIDARRYSAQMRNRKTESERGREDKKLLFRFSERWWWLIQSNSDQIRATANAKSERKNAPVRRIRRTDRYNNLVSSAWTLSAKLNYDLITNSNLSPVSRVMFAQTLSAFLRFQLSSSTNERTSYASYAILPPSGNALILITYRIQSFNVSL